MGYTIALLLGIPILGVIYFTLGSWLYDLLKERFNKKINKNE